DNVTSSGLTKKELLGLSRERDKLAKSLGGIRDMAKPPQAVWIVDTKKEHLAVDEARKLKIPVIAILDTNCDPDEVDYPIPGNDDAIRAVSLLTRVIADAVADGLLARSQTVVADPQEAAEPMPDWERELLASGAPAPAAESAEAATEAPAPVAEPVVEAPAPEPVVEAPASVPEPAAEAIAPEPVVEAAAPVAEPVVEAPLPEPELATPEAVQSDSASA
ncbi:MAG: 30S ribosomal protein S2, partial [Propionibacteriaceae bacterium]|nr:30S ribosomal protein S2 [Propionibacteriaceae bacterium]